MKPITVSSKGQVALPKEIRDALHLDAGSQLAPSIENGALVLVPVVTVPQTQAWAWTPEWQKKVSDSQKDVKRGRTVSFSSVEEMREALGS